MVAGEPDGENINDGVGSTHIDSLVEVVLRHQADLGIALDGDADRCLAVDAAGAVVDGDQILAICARELKDRSLLAQDTVVATVMSNLGFHHAMREAGITVLTTAVGDRYVLESLLSNGLSLGGEQSGHVIFTDAATTGDGLLTALRLMSCMAAAGRPLAELAAIVQRLPQVMINVRVADRESGGRLARRPGGGVGGRGRTRRGRPDPAAALGHRAAGPGDGGGRQPGTRRADRAPGVRGRRRRLAPGRDRAVLGRMAPARALLAVPPPGRGEPAARAARVGPRDD